MWLCHSQRVKVQNEDKDTKKIKIKIIPISYHNELQKYHLMMKLAKKKKKNDILKMRP